ncbi:MAG: putative colanic acid biosynthesis acetyltransferase [Bacteroidetes bacterium]|nr:putative colanic acid biosynthesis acetyltransferase [Bacteroidota bacterium]
MSADKFEQFRYKNEFSRSSKIKRFIWNIVYLLLFRPTPGWALHGWRIFLLRCFGAKVGNNCKIYPSCRIWAPWNLELGSFVCLAEHVDCYSVALIKMGSKVTISQRSFICTASHDIGLLNRPLIHKPIEIADHAWVCAESFLAPGVIVGEGAVIGARSAVFKDVEAWSVVGGNPAKFIKKRILRDGN